MTGYDPAPTEESIPFLSFYFEKEHKIYFLIKLFTVSCYTILLWWAILEFYWYPGQF